MPLCSLCDFEAFLALFTLLLVHGQSPNDVVSDDPPTPICCTIQPTAGAGLLASRMAITTLPCCAGSLTVGLC